MIFSQANHFAGAAAQAFDFNVSLHSSYASFNFFFIFVLVVLLFLFLLSTWNKYKQFFETLQDLLYKFVQVFFTTHS